MVTFVRLPFALVDGVLLWPALRIRGLRRSATLSDDGICGGWGRTNSRPSSVVSGGHKKSYNNYTENQRKSDTSWLLKETSTLVPIYALDNSWLLKETSHRTFGNTSLLWSNQQRLEHFVSDWRPLSGEWKLNKRTSNESITTFSLNVLPSLQRVSWFALIIDALFFEEPLRWTRHWIQQYMLYTIIYCY